MDNLIQGKAEAAVEVVSPSAIPAPAASACQWASSTWPSAEGNEMILSGLIWDDLCNYLCPPGSSQ